LYAALRNAQAFAIKAVPRLTAKLQAVGLDPDDTSTNVTTPVGIANVVVAAGIAARNSNGWNSLGTDHDYNRRNYSDPTGFLSGNSAFGPVIFPYNWYV
jgi:hypothetical protein